MQDSIIDNQIENYPRSTIVLYLNICLLLQHRLNEPNCFVVICHIVFHVGNHIKLILLVGLLTNEKSLSSERFHIFQNRLHRTLDIQLDTFNSGIVATDK